MKEHYLSLAGLRTVLRAPWEIAISERLKPFLQEPFHQTDCIITVQPQAVLPSSSEGGTWRGLEYYDCHENIMRVFHCSAPGAAAFAVTRLFENGRIEIGVLPAFLSYFKDSSGIFNRIGMETLLLQHRGLLLHASLIQYAGQTIAFSGPSGVGKSTQAELWRTSLGADIINGDRAVLRHTEAGWIAYGSPYAGTSGIYKNESAPLAAIVVLRQAKENSLRRLNAPEALAHLYREVSVHQWDKHFVTRVTDLCLELLSEAPVYLLECVPEESAAFLVKKGLGL